MVSESDTLIPLPHVSDLTFREWHALVDGFYCGVNKIQESEYSRERHYWRIGWVLGDAYDIHLR